MSKTSRTKPLRLVDSRLAHNGAEYCLPEWLAPGQSFFLPTLKGEYLAEKVKARYAQRGMRMTHEERIEADLLGIRIWRVL
jgi:hypothetical protein